MGIFDLYDDDELVRSFGSVTVAVAGSTSARGRVLSLEVSDANPRITLVRGQRARAPAGGTYATTVTLVEDPSGAWIDAHCTCPVVRMCKHAAALMIAATERAGDPSTPARDWERRLGLVLDELDRTRRGRAAPQEPAGAAGRAAPRASRVAVERVGGRGPHLPRAAPGPAGAAGRPRQLGEPQVLVARRPNLDHRHRRRPGAGRRPGRAAVGAPGGEPAGLLRRRRAPVVHDVRPGGVAAAAAGGAVGLALRAGRELSERPGRGRAGVPAAGRQRRRHRAGPLQVGVDHEEEWFSGDPAGGARRQPVTGSRCGRRRAPRAGVGRRARARSSRPAGHADPPADRRRPHAAGAEAPTSTTSSADYLPRLQRHLPVVSSDETVRLPEPGGAAAGPDGAPGRPSTRCTWPGRWRYRVGDDDRIYGLDETRGLRGIRRPDAEQALLDALELDEEQRAPALRRGRRAPRADARADVHRAGGRSPSLEETLVPARGRPARSRSRRSAPGPTSTSSPSAPVIRFEPRARRRRADESAGRAHRLARPRGRRHRSATGHVGLAQLLEAMTLGRGADHPARRGAPADRPARSSPSSPSWSARPASWRSSRATASGSATHDLGLWAELAEIGLVDAQASAVGAGRPGAAATSTGCRRWSRSGSTAELRPTSSTGSAGWRSCGSRGSAGSSPTTWGWARRCRRWRWSRTPGPAAAAPFLVVAPTSVVGDLGARGGHVHPGADACARSPSRGRGAGVASREVARRAPTSWSPPTRSTGWRRTDYARARLGRAGARRGADGEEPPGQDLPGGAPARRAVPAGAHRHADGEPADGAVVAAVDRRAGALPLPAAVRRGGGQPGGEGGRRRGARRGSGAGSGRSCCAAPRSWWPPTCRRSRSRCSRCS